MAQNNPSKKPEDQKAEIDLLTEETANLKKKIAEFDKLLKESESVRSDQARTLQKAAETIQKLQAADPNATPAKGQTAVGQASVSSAELRQLTAILIGPVGLAPDHTPWSGNTWNSLKHGILQTATDMASMIVAKIPD